MILLLALLIILAFIGLITVLFLILLAFMTRAVADTFDSYDPSVVYSAYEDAEIEEAIQKDIKRKKKRK